MKGGNVMECARRFGRALAGKMDPSIASVCDEAEAVSAVIKTMIDPTGVGDALRAIYDPVLFEPVPDQLKRVVEGFRSGPVAYPFERGEANLARH